LFIEHNGVLYPIEVKQSSTPGAHVTTAFKVLKAQKRVAIAAVGDGCAICLADYLMPLNDQALALPVSLL
jgi:hypothetical protein